ncbi:UNKNOWN [Stylonychia lemnae]|uniref:Uncharacterized protein n=1 Tax=Stylonychia lemnae TaxID=5949 RepID=A0A078BAQ5_STYLE|nr:UNKNOWN [Stylonychia lemnae]|eukprot:CDW90332.1 UNKNOWN [Stylonychia lemnae]
MNSENWMGSLGNPKFHDKESQFNDRIDRFLCPARNDKQDQSLDFCEGDSSEFDLEFKNLYSIKILVNYKKTLIHLLLKKLLLLLTIIPIKHNGIMSSLKLIYKNQKKSKYSNFNHPILKQIKANKLKAFLSKRKREKKEDHQKMKQNYSLIQKRKE